ncbi:triose-phosphate isomerase [Pseudoramibacter alactolyticus ATCC 23263]|uniref:Triosephosphate isomerase n=1 Tax=Pseudoramibacter alactolyticus ATCC 23263 TaxID=887929 RepID=E6MG41_9FIRM|nr:triose-phosphate isomerase family protein [Pseudoramibacter alactolyticus]EFV01581.1 triose-phosphate isomerase [Pseudoramibacter alactolyticus ATCC 23263]
MKNFIIGSGWKMELSYQKSIEVAKQLDKNLANFHDFPVVIFPSFTVLSAIKQTISPHSALKIGGQDLSWKEYGPYTGEISAAMLLDVGCEYVEINHQERRKYLHEDNQMANLKLKAALRNGLKPFLCIGEEEKGNQNQTENFISSQLKELLNTIPKFEATNIIFAYEPKWAIGQYGLIELKHIQNIHALIRNCLSFLYDDAFAQDIKIVYGGGITMERYKDISKLPDVNGLFTTRCGINPKTYTELILQSAQIIN